MSCRLSFVPINVGPRQQELIDELDNTLDALLYVAMLEHLYHSAEHSAEVLVLCWGWNDGKSF